MVAYAETPIPDRPDGNPQPASGLAWYTNYDLNWAGVPADAFAGAGAGNQVLIVVPSLQMIIVRNGSQIDEKGFWGGVVDHLLNPLIAAIRT
jgi:CubicO group peptidase (beta-lactamase class C family)